MANGTTDDPLNVLLVLGSVRPERLNERVGRFITDRLAAGGVRVTVADPMAIELPLLTRMFKSYPSGEAPEPMQRLANMIVAADAVVVTSAEYNHGIPPALKNLLDHYLEEWFHKPAGIATYSAGRFGGVRAAMQLRMTLTELGMPTIPTLLAIPTAGKALSEDGTTQDEGLKKSADRFVAELAWWAAAARAQIRHAGPPGAK